MLKLFRDARFIEGMSYLVILCVPLGLISEKISLIAPYDLLLHGS